jgi:hypothetical protein
MVVMHPIKPATRIRVVRITAGTLVRLISVTPSSPPPAATTGDRGPR